MLLHRGGTQWGHFIKICVFCICLCSWNQILVLIRAIWHLGEKRIVWLRVKVTAIKICNVSSRLRHELCLSIWQQHDSLHFSSPAAFVLLDGGREQAFACALYYLAAHSKRWFALQNTNIYGIVSVYYYILANYPMNMLRKIEMRFRIFQIRSWDYVWGGREIVSESRSSV